MTNYNLTAREIMQVEIATILADATVAEAAQQMRLEGVRSLIIVPKSAGDPFGIVTFSDIVYKVLAEGRDAKNTRVEEIMTKPVVTVGPDMKASYIAKLFCQTRIGHVPVVDCGELLGMVSMTDLITEVIADPI